MTNTAITLHRPGLLGRGVFDDVFDNLFNDSFPNLLRQVRAKSNIEESESSNRRIARRSFEKTYVNYDNNLDLAAISAEFENGLLRIIVPAKIETKPILIDIK